MELITGTVTLEGPAERFTGEVHLDMIETPAEPARLAVALVRFAPGARTNWHSHALGQVLHVVDGVALVGTRDGSVVRATAGQTIKCPPGEEHWHGATDERFMSHLAMVVGDGHGDGTTWSEPVTDRQYVAALVAAVPKTRG